MDEDQRTRLERLQSFGREWELDFELEYHHLS